MSPLDVTDVFQEQVVPDSNSPSGKHNIQGRAGSGHPDSRDVSREPRRRWRARQCGVRTPRRFHTARHTDRAARNNGPIVQLDLATGAAISVQYTGFSGTREVDTLWTWNRARGLDDFRRGLQSFDSGTLNFAYADIDGNIAYFAAAEVPIREDLQNGTVAGLPPWFIRNGTAKTSGCRSRIRSLGRPSRTRSCPQARCRIW